MKYNIILTPIDKKFTFRIERGNENFDLKVGTANLFFDTSEQAIEFAKKQLGKIGIDSKYIHVSNGI